MQRPISIAYVIQSLGPGGAERQLVELATHLDRARFAARVLTYFPGDFYRAQLDQAGIPVHELRRKGKLDLSPVWQLAKWLRAGEVDIVHGYLSSANLYAVLSRQLARRGAAIVSERSLPEVYTDWRNLYRRWSMRTANVVVANSNTAQQWIMSELSLSRDRVCFIPNGLDFHKYRAATITERQLVRQRLGWRNDTQYVLTVANYSAVKNHDGILDALTGDPAHAGYQQLIWAGAPVPEYRYQQLLTRIAALGLSERVMPLGVRSDVIDLYHAADVLLLNSTVEGSPNVVLEALACGCPVIATDVSDVSRYVISGQTGWLIPPADSTALQHVLAQVATMNSAQLRQMGINGREHLLQLGMDSDSLARRHEAVYSSVWSNSFRAVSDNSIDSVGQV